MRDANGLETIDGMEYIASVPVGENIISMCVVDDTLFIATDRHLYTLEDDKRLEQIK